jgi:hypothetical protein
MGFGDALSDRQAQAGSCIATGMYLIYTIETFKYMQQVRMVLQLMPKWSAPTRLTTWPC